MAEKPARQPTKLTVRERSRQIRFSEETWTNESGEPVDLTIQTVVAGDLDFQKFWVANILAAVDEISNAKMKVLWYLMRVVDPHTNAIMETIKQIAEGSGTSIDTVQRTLKVLTSPKHDILRRPHPQIPVLTFNPNVLMNGNTKKRKALLIRFEQMPLPLFADAEERKALT